MQFKGGDRVRLVNGNNAGKEGEVLKFVSSKQRYLIKLDDGRKRRIKEEALQKISGGMSTIGESVAARAEPRVCGRAWQRTTPPSLPARCTLSPRPRCALMSLYRTAADCLRCLPERIEAENRKRKQEAAARIQREFEAKHAAHPDSRLACGRGRAGPRAPTPGKARLPPPRSLHRPTASQHGQPPRVGYRLHVPQEPPTPPRPAFPHSTAG